MGAADELHERLVDFCSDRCGRRVEVTDLARMSGGASRETWSFTVVDGDTTRRLVLRRDPSGSPGRTQRAAEVELLRRAADAGVPVPNVVWTDDEGALGSPGFVMDHIDGETIARRILREPEYADARRIMAAQCGEILARIHRIAPDGMAGLAMPEQEATAGVLEQYTQLLDSFGEPHPAFELALRWLTQRRPPTTRVTVVHGDFRNGNLIVGPDGVRAVLDWELVHLGDPWEDLAWLCMRSWRFGGDGEVGGFGDREDLYAAYERESGMPVDREAVHWWEIMSSVKWGIMTIGQAFTHLLGHVPSLELAAIGRRTVENEYDVLRLIKTGGGPLRAPARSQLIGGAPRPSGAAPPEPPATVGT